MVIFNGEKSELKYLFEAEMSDGEVYKQTPEDISVSTSDKSAFFDIANKELNNFTLKGKHIYSVDLKDGSFSVDGIKFDTCLEPISNIRLVYFRRHKHNSNITGEQVSHEIEYHFGYQANLEDGSNIQHVIILS